MENTAKQLISPSDFYIPYFETENKVIYVGIPIKIKTYGQALFSAPLILINYGVTKAIPEKSFKNLDNIIGSDKIINPDKHTIVEFEIDAESSYSFTYESYTHFSKKDMDKIINIAISQFNLPEPQLIYTI
jgi:hypothetical protein